MTADEWKARYIERLVSRGLSRNFATADYEAGEHAFDFSENPEYAADDEIDCMSAMRHNNDR